MKRSATNPGFNAAAALLLLLCAFAFAGCGGSSKHFDATGYPFSFSYPGTWTLTRSGVAGDASTGTDLKAVSVALKEPFDQVTLNQYKLKKTLPSGVNGNQNEVDRIVKQLTREAKGSAGDGKAVKFGGLPGYQYVVEYPGGGGLQLKNKLTFLFRGQDEFQINCQSSPKNFDAMNKGCDQILESLKFK